MIGSTSSGASFGALGSYLERGKGDVPAEDRVAWVEGRGLVREVDGSVSVERSARFMEATADLNPRCTEPCYHVSISFDPSDLPGGPSDPASREVMLGVARDTLRDLGLHEHEVVVVAHGDRSHPHVHMMINRVHPETGRAWDRWQDRVRLERSLRGQERARGLREVPGRLGRLEGQERPARGLSRGAQRAAMREAERTGERPPLEQARADLRGDFEGAKTWDDLEGRLAKEGYVLRAKGRGLVVRDGRGREVKASAVARNGGRGQLEKRFGEGFRVHRARVEARTGPVPAGLSPHAEAVVRAERDREVAAELRAAAGRAGRRVGSAEGSVRALADQEREVAGAWQGVRDRLRGVYEDPAGAERLFVRLSRTEGLERACEELAQRPERFGRLRETEHRKWGGLAVERRTDAARAAASGAALEGAQYGERWRALERERERAPRALREAKGARERARAAVAARPGEHVAAGRVEGLGKALQPVDRQMLEKAAPGVSRSVGAVVAKALAREAERGYDLGR
ncbi:relaxase/mobilization nuclease domain-containing protein [Rubrivirga sp. S365]|uniref:relaxase/mobilization nuclease domain-containing protein n=1 Tax=Rubrivirga sp. S365 TaxID=3076080 RepID=UPI0028C6BC35|nr:relaxase/mobilization nuclease domain-containing protein [Rubrivirga sp. S365]MDT7858293.1 relaxase/mobilization nuclease domain-containing protein [Rubrivirga sp. S365]